MRTQTVGHLKPAAISRGDTLKKRLLKNRWMYYMLTPGILYFLVFKYAPMWGVLIAFQDYSPFTGFWDSPWIGFQHFQTFFSEPEF
ncbi:MAG: protein lplB, partial [Paenibacillus sp.]|nr:protein lplB [Paenibacillus sp.]